MTFSTNCMATFDMAFNHHVIELHKNRLIVLTMFDSSTETAMTGSGTECLGMYVKQYKCVKYDEGDWLNRLLYALPVKGMLQRQNCTQNDDGNDLDLPAEDEALLNP